MLGYPAELGVVAMVVRMATGGRFGKAGGLCFWILGDTFSTAGTCASIIEL